MNENLVQNTSELVWLSGRLGQSFTQDGYYFESLAREAHSSGGYVTLSLHYPQFQALVIPPAFNQRVLSGAPASSGTRLLFQRCRKSREWPTEKRRRRPRCPCRPPTARAAAAAAAGGGGRRNTHRVSGLLLCVRACVMDALLLLLILELY